MSSINGFSTFSSMFQAAGTGRIDNDTPRPNPLDKPDKNDVEHFTPRPQGKPLDTSRFYSLSQILLGNMASRIDNDKPMHNSLDKTAGDDAEMFDPATQSWQPTQAAGNGQYAPLGDPYREAIDFEIKSDNMGGWVRA
ncbi:hypothetical protein [Pseudomonas sp. 2822-17]|uniref:hypothetical protein n=1 Tax=Pseudomonas sp. 2822-17 TaxID=1712678 RepID=UPI000C16055C|nr:hypothetical protein [Pseudomonas sp. 2822-17]PIB53272.1 hypothetical protein AOA60_24495 [Pseudomonas sp. 2822-17]